VKRNTSHLSFKGINDKLKVRWVHTLYTFLYNMVPILVFHTLCHMSIKLFDDFNLQKYKTNKMIH